MQLKNPFSKFRLISHLLPVGYLNLQNSLQTPLLNKQTNTVSQEKKDLLIEAYGHLEKYLDGKKWLCGDSYTIADISVVTTLSSIQVHHLSYH